LFSKLGSWFGNLSGPKKVAALVVAAATGIGAVVGAINGSIDLYKKLAETQSKANLTQSRANPLELVDVSFTKVGEDPVLDIKLTNVGEDPVIIKRANFQVKKIWTLKPPYFMDWDKCQPSVLASSYNYEIALPTKGAPYTISESLSQSVGPNKSDRFTITLGRTNPKKSRHLDLVFLMRASLVYGAADKTLLSKPLLYADSNVYGTWVYYPGECKSAQDNLDKLTESNETAMAEIQHIEAPSNTYLKGLAHHIQ
jgi:hypothetical protein